MKESASIKAKLIRMLRAWGNSRGNSQPAIGLQDIQATSLTGIRASASWSAKDFLVNGVNCPIPEIRATVEAIRRASNADWILLLVYREEPKALSTKSQTDPIIVSKHRFFQSLTTLVHHDESKLRVADQFAIDKTIISDAEEEVFMPPISGVIPLQLLDLLPIPTGIRTFLTRTTKVHNLGCLWINESGSSEVLPPTGYPTRLCLVGSRVTISSLRVEQRPLLDELLVRVCSTVPIAVHRNLSLTKLAELVMNHYEARFQIEHLVSESTSSSDYSSMVEKFGSSVVMSALKLSGSSVGNLYLSTSNKRRLTLLSEVNNFNRLAVLSLDQEPSVVSYVYKTTKPLLINDIPEFRQTHPEIEYKWVGATNDGQEAYAELAIPIIQPDPGSLEPHVLGVLNVEKVKGRDRGFYSDHDLSILTMLALRFCLWRVRLASAIANRSMAYNSPLHQNEDPPATERQSENSLIPCDFYEAYGVLSNALRQAYELTRSKSATIRLLSTDARFLVRFCAYPLESLKDPHDCISVSRHDSINAYVALTGSICYIRDLHRAESFAQYPPLATSLIVREGIASEYCLPIFVRNRLVGTMNLESEYKDAYSGERHFLDAILEQASVALEFSHSKAERLILSASARLSLNTHEVMKCSDELAELEAAVPAYVRPTILNICMRLKECANIKDKLSLAQRALSDRPPLAFIDCIKEVVESMDMQYLVRYDKSLDDMGENLPDEYVSNVKLSLGEVLSNSSLRIMKVPNGRIWVSYRNIRRGGKEFGVITVAHLLGDEGINEQTCRQLYRVPIRKADRYHIGAFIAGSVMRAVGGDIVFRVKNTRSHVASDIEIPIHAEEKK